MPLLLGPDGLCSSLSVEQDFQEGAGRSGAGPWRTTLRSSVRFSLLFVWSEVADVWYAAMRDEVWDLEDPLVGPQLFNMGKYSDAVDSTKAKAARSCPSRSSMPTVV